MNKWERRLRREGLGMSRGRDSRLTYGLDPRLDPTHGLVSPVYALSPSGDYYSDEERERRAKIALKSLIKKHGKDHVWLTIKRAPLPFDQEPLRIGLLKTLDGLQG